jgi:glycosyltransferase involved in cell wall biosynthesis
MRPLVVIPAFNEAGTIGKVIEGIRATDPRLPVLVVDDGSADDTAAVAKQAGARVVRLPFNLGYGTALQTGYKYALREGYDCVVQLDGDGQHEPADIPRLLAVLERGDADMVIGSRFLGEPSYRPGAARRIGMRVFRLFAFVLTGLRFTDVTSGFQALDRPVLRFFAAERYPVDYPDADVLVMLTRAGFRVAEAPVRMYPKPGARSMHAGLRPVYYIFKMLLSMLLTVLRREGSDRKGR